MPRFKPDTLRQIGCQLFEAAGCSSEDARFVANHLVESNLFGHDSHGVIRYPEYIRAIGDGRFKVGGSAVIVRETPCTAVVDGDGALGQLGGRFAMELAMKKAGEHGLGAVTLRNSCHLGRIGAYPLLAAEAGYMALAFVNAGHLGYQIAPFGGLDGRLSTNPIAFAAPRRDSKPIMVDMTTSVVAEGKVRVAINKGRSVPEGWLIDSAGEPTTDPRAFIADPPGAILPLGGVVAHKGYGLSIVVELLGGALSGEGCAAGAKVLHSNGVMFTVYNIEHFTERDSYYDELENLLRHIRSSRLAPGFSEILAPGEPEFRSAQRRAQEGIEVDDTTWGKIMAVARSVGVDPASWKL